MSNVLRICIWGIVALLLAAVLVTGLFAHDGFADFGLGELFSSFSSLTSYRYDGAEEYTSGGASLPAGAFVNAVEVSWVAGNVNIRFTDANQITFSETAKRGLDKDEQLHYRVKDGKLFIQFCSSQWKPFTNMPGKTLELTIPRSMSLTGLRVETVSADVNAGGAEVLLDALSIETVSGQITFEGFSGRRLDAESVSGRLAITGAFVEITAHSVSGGMALRLYDMPRRLDAETVSGNVRLTLPENSGFTVKFSSISGRLRCPSADMPRGTAVYGDGSGQIGIETVSGGATIEMDASLDRVGIPAGYIPEIPPAPPEIPPVPPEMEPVPPVPSSGRNF